MAESTVHRSVLESFRGVWVRGRLDYLRALEALEEATRAAERLRSASADEENVCRAEEDVETARQRVTETEAALERQFDRFCGGAR